MTFGISRAAGRDPSGSRLIPKVIEKTEGITLDEYKEIARAAQNNPDLRSQLEDMMQAKLGN